MTYSAFRPLKISAALGLLIGLSVIAAPSAAAAEHCCHRSPNIAISSQNGVSVHRPAALVDRAAMQRLATARAKAAAHHARKRRAATQRAALNARLDQITAQNEQILAAQTQAVHNRRRRNVYSGNSPFFGPNGFIGNSNFSGAITPVRRRNRRRPAGLKPARY